MGGQGRAGRLADEHIRADRTRAGGSALTTAAVGMHPLQALQAVLGNRGVGELIEKPPVAVQRMQAQPLVPTVQRPPGLSRKPEKEEESDSDSDTPTRVPASPSKKRKKEKKGKREKKEKKEKKKEKKKARKQERRAARDLRDQLFALTPAPDPAWQQNRDDLAFLLTGDADSSLALDPPVQRHSITEVTFANSQGHNVVTTVTGDDVATMTWYRDSIVAGKFDACRRRNSRTVEIDIDGRVFGCSDYQLGHTALFPVSGPTCTPLLTGDELQCLVYIRNAKAVTNDVQRWYTHGEIPTAKAALALAGIAIP
jgi:hypothetical protein